MSITSRINEIETHLKEDYTNLEALGYDIPQDKNIENIASVLDNVWENQSHIEETGTTLSMNTNKGKAKVDLLGNTYQETTTGKNLLNCSLTTLKSLNSTSYGTWSGDIFTSNAGVVFTPIYKGNELQYINVNGTSTGENSTFVLGRGVMLANQPMTLSGCPSGGSTGTYFLHQDSFGNDTGSGATATSTTEITNKNVYIRIVQDQSVSNIKFYPMLEQSSTPTNYEPYVGSTPTQITPSPNPSYPQNIHVVSGNNEVSVCGKNLAPVNKVSLTGTTTPYEPYIGTTYPINLGDIELCKIGTYQDKFFKAINGNTIYDNLDSSIKDTLDYGEWYLEKNISKVVLDGTNTKITSVGSLNNIYYGIYQKPTGFKAETIPMSNCYKGGTPLVVKGRIYTPTNSNLVMCDTGSSLTTKELWNAWLKDKYDNDNPVIIFYVGYAPTYTKIEGTLASQLEDVWRANTYDNQTNVSQVNNDLPFELYFKALGTPSNTLLGLSRNLQLNNPIENVEEIEEQPLNEIEEESGE